jgi:tRNA U34 2-thiouridine synthase MnmA/TrmU
MQGSCRCQAWRTTTRHLAEKKIPRPLNLIKFYWRTVPNISRTSSIMNSRSKKVRGLGLCSGGLDSMLAGLVLRDQGIPVEWINFETPFFSSAKARKASRITGIPLTVRSITPVYVEMLKNPPCGYGKCMNPCLDCHALMFKIAGELMKERGFNFLFSGEVLGQRPMSQTKPSLRYVEKHSGFEGYILRPLSARGLPETIPEKKGWVKREEMLKLAGRSRKPQIKLAKKFGIAEYPAPAGGCLLTDKGFSRRLKDFFDQQSTWTEDELYLLKYGRHLRVNPGTKIIIGRTQDDNQNLLKYHDPQQDTILELKEYPSPITLVPRGGSKDILTLAASLCAGYSKAPRDVPLEVLVTKPDSRETVTVLGIPPKDFAHLMI